MAEDQDKSQKTEEPTPRKLEEARKKGQVATSQEVKHWFVLLGVLIVILAFAPMAARDMTQGMAAYLGTVHAIPTDARSLLDFLTGAVIRFALILMLPLLTLVVMALAGTLVQNGLVASAESLKPNLEKISPLKGAKRLFSTKAIVEFIKGLLKISIVGAVAAAVIVPEFAGIEQFAGLSAGLILKQVWVMSLKMLVAVLAVMTIIAGLDFLYQRYEFTRQQRMTRQEVKDEYKQTEGDPMVKARLRQIRMERARRRMMAAVPQADVVITNPTHYAIAMAYDPAAMAAPKVVAKGVDALALRIREVARANDVTVVENPPLARALYQAVDIDDEVPPEHYKAVAEVISYVFKLRKRHVPSAAAHG